MRTKWQSSSVAGNTTETGLKGNHKPGDGFVPVWEILLDLSRKIYSMCCHLKNFADSVYYQLFMYDGHAVNLW